MAVSAHAYNAAAKHLMNGDVAFLSDTIKAMLLATYTPSAAHDTLTDVLGAGTETSGSGYSAGGATLGSKTIATVSTVTTVDSADVSWTTSNPGTLAGAYIVYYKSTGTNSTSYVLAYEDLGGTQTASNGGAFSSTVPGVLAFTAA